MYFFMNKREILNEKGIAKLLFEDVSTDSWDRANLTKYNLDFTLESLVFIDEYVANLQTAANKNVLATHASHLAYRIGAYLGEVMKLYISKDFQWYELATIEKYSAKVARYDLDKTSVHLYSKKNDTVILPAFEVSKYLAGNANYPKLSLYVKDIINHQNK